MSGSAPPLTAVTRKESALEVPLTRAWRLFKTSNKRDDNRQEILELLSHTVYIAKEITSNTNDEDREALFVTFERYTRKFNELIESNPESSSKKTMNQAKRALQNLNTAIETPTVQEPLKMVDVLAYIKGIVPSTASEISSRVVVAAHLCTDGITQENRIEDVLEYSDTPEYVLQRFEPAVKVDNPNLQVFLQEKKRHHWTKSGLAFRRIDRQTALGNLPRDGPLELFVVDRTQEYTIAILGHDYSSSSAEPDAAFIIDMTQDVDGYIKDRLLSSGTPSQYHYRWGNEKIPVWGGTPRKRGVNAFSCDIFVIRMPPPPPPS